VLDRVGSADILQGSAGVLDVAISVDGVPTDPEASPAPTVTVLDGAGAVLVATTSAAIVGSGSGKLRLALSAPQTAQPNDLTANWTFTVAGAEQTATTYHRIVGDVLFSLGEARAFDGGALANSATYPDAAILAARDRIGEAFAEICGTAFGVRYSRDVLDGSGTPELGLHGDHVLSVRGVAVRTGPTWTALTPGELADVLFDPEGLLVRDTLGTFPAGRRNVAVEYEYGFQPVPAEIRLAALRLLRDQLVKSPLDDRATSQAGEFGTFSLATAGRNGSYFGLPLVDEVLNRYRERVPVVA